VFAQIVAVKLEAIYGLGSLIQGDRKKPDWSEGDERSDRGKGGRQKALLLNAAHNFRGRKGAPKGKGGK